MFSHMIGLYDSGLGGVTVMNEIHKIFPLVDIIYVADTDSLPLGEKSGEEISTRVEDAVKSLYNAGCELVILACNTATCWSIKDLQSRYPDQYILGISRTLTEVLERQEIDKQTSVGLLATTATIQSQYYQFDLEKFGYQSVVSIPSQNLVRAIEAQHEGLIYSELDILWCQYIQKTKPEVLLLACTHYHCIRDMIADYFRDRYSYEPQLIDHMAGLDHKIYSYMFRKGLKTKENGEVKALCTSYPQLFQNKVQKWYPDLNIHECTNLVMVKDRV
jgi:glutamate racemase